MEQVVYEIGKSETRWNLEDLVQDIYLDLIRKNKVQDIPEKQLRFYLARIVINNIHSRTSPYYTTYKKSECEDLDVKIERDNG